jgi:SAM-dependent methyltransferase
MKSLTKRMLRAIQQLHLDETMIRASRLPLVRNVATSGWDDRSKELYATLHDTYKRILEKNHVSLRGKNVLEIGAGASMGAGFFFVDEPFNAWIASDLSRSPVQDDAHQRHELALARAVAAQKGVSLSELVTSGKPLRYAERFAFRKLDTGRFEWQLGASFDIILSNAVLEHIPAELLPRSIRNLTRYLRPGGHMVHIIDLRDHVNMANPFHFYRYSRVAWNRLTKDTIFYTNRWRAGDFLSEFGRNGLRIVDIAVVRAPVPRFHEEFARYGKDDLAIARLEVVLQKPLEKQGKRASSPHYKGRNP